MSTDHDRGAQRNDRDLFEEGLHVFDLALAEGLDAGRYVLVTDPTDPDSSPRMNRGPCFDRPPTGPQHIVWMQKQIDDSIRCWEADRR